ncbi:MAG: hypothetical protein QOH63_1988 [Acidobacteriota bacterium]|jgi:hypothetical protein|nr:hypothetical protein [Acidobacteriota bacterium]
MSVVAIHDCFGTVIQVTDTDIIFLGDKCGKPHAWLNEDGLSTTKEHGKEKDRHIIPLQALETMIAEVKRRKKKK